MNEIRPEAAFGADLIAGFPTESEAMFQNSLALVADAGFSSLHVFPFSPRPGTPAARMPQLERQTTKARAARLRGKGDAALAAHFATLVGSQKEILLEKGGIGRTTCFAPVSFAGAAGRFVTVDVIGAGSGQLVGQLAA